MAEFFTNPDTYNGVPVYRSFKYSTFCKYPDVEYSNPCKDLEVKTLSPVWTASGLLIPIAHSDSPAYMCIPREECIKMANDILHLDMVREICESLNKRSNTAIDKAINKKADS